MTSLSYALLVFMFVMALVGYYAYHYHDEK